LATVAFEGRLIKAEGMYAGDPKVISEVASWLAGDPA
jgi:hypothetical protein